jgi:CRP-like cAMP-binding protein
VLERLRGIPLFASLDVDQLNRLARATTEFEVPAGQPLIEKGAPGSGIFVLVEGQAWVDAPEGGRQLEPGEVFGQRSLFDDSQRTARVRAQTDVRCLAISRVEIEQLLAEDPQLAAELRELGA